MSTFESGGDATWVSQVYPEDVDEKIDLLRKPFVDKKTEEIVDEVNKDGAINHNSEYADAATKETFLGTEVSRKQAMEAAEDWVDENLNAVKARYQVLFDTNQLNEIAQTQHRLKHVADLLEEMSERSEIAGLANSFADWNEDSAYEFKEDFVTFVHSATGTHWRMAKNLHGVVLAEAMIQKSLRRLLVEMPTAILNEWSEAEGFFDIFTSKDSLNYISIGASAGSLATLKLPAVSVILSAVGLGLAIGSTAMEDVADEVTLELDIPDFTNLSCEEAMQHIFNIIDEIEGARDEERGEIAYDLRKNFQGETSSFSTRDKIPSNLVPGSELIG